MSDKKISQLTASATLTGTELVPIVQTGNTIRTTVLDIANLALSAANNGLYVSDGNTVRLGTNPLLEDTTIDLAGFLLSMGNDGNAALVLEPATGISRLGAFGAVTNNTYITVDDTISQIKLNVDIGGGAFTQGINLDGVNDSYKFGNNNTIALQIIGGITQTIKTFATGSNFGINVDYVNGYTAMGDIDNVFNNFHTNLFIDSLNGYVYFSSNYNNVSLHLYGYENSTYSCTKLGDPFPLFNGTKIVINSGVLNDLIEFYSLPGNYIFNNVPTYADNTAALAGGLIAGNIYKLRAIMGQASLLSIVY